MKKKKTKEKQKKKKLFFSRLQSESSTDVDLRVNGKFVCSLFIDKKNRPSKKPNWKKGNDANERTKKNFHNFYNSISSITQLFGASATNSHITFFVCLYFFFWFQFMCYDFHFLIIFTVCACAFQGLIVFSDFSTIIAYSNTAYASILKKN